MNNDLMKLAVCVCAFGAAITEDPAWGIFIVVAFDYWLSPR